MKVHAQTGDTKNGDYAIFAPSKIEPGKNTTPSFLTFFTNVNFAYAQNCTFTINECVKSGSNYKT